jgi:hypothetical protein
MRNESPSPNGRNGNGRFARGNAGGPGNPHGRRVAQLRSVLLGEVTDDDLRAVVRALIAQAKNGDRDAVRELLDRLFGRPAQADVLERLSALEASAEESTEEQPWVSKSD